MIRDKVKSKSNEIQKFNQITKKSNIIFNIIFAIIVFTCILPLVFVIIISFSSEHSIMVNGYSFIPEKLSLDAYKFIFKSGSQVLHSIGISVIVTITGVFLGLFLTTTYAYAISRKNYRFRKFFTGMLIVTMFFNGGMVANYLVVSNFLSMKNTIYALVFPIAVSAFNIVVMRTFFSTTVPDALIESAKIDGASQFHIFFKIVLPISLPGIATIGLFLTLSYWNDWKNALLYIDAKKLYPLQYLLMQIERNIDFISQNSGRTSGFDQAIANLPSETVKMAIVVIATLPIACAYPFFQKYFVSGLTIGSVKE